MAATTTMTVRLPARIKARLEILARSTERSKTYLANRAIEEYLESQEWQVKAIQEAVHEADSAGAALLDHEDVEIRLKRLTASAKNKKKSAR